MTLDEVRARIAAIQKAADAGDDERAHSLEDGLRLDVLAAIATGSIVPKHAQQLCSLAISTESIEFERWGA